MNGVVLYVDLIRLEEVADRYSQIDMQMKSLLSSYESSISYLKGCEYRGEIPPNMIGVHNAEMQEIEERIRSLQSCLKSVLNIYRGYEKEFHAREIGNLYETTPFYKTNGFKIGVGAFVVTGCVVLAVVAFPGVAIVTGAAVGSALGAAFGGTIGGITAERNGGSFLDGFADGMLVGAIGGAISGAVGEATATAGLVVSVVANGVTDSAIYAGETAYRGGEIKAQGLAVSFFTGAVLSGVTRISVGKYGKSQRIESGIETIKFNEVKTFTAEETNQWFIDNVKPDYKPPYKPGILVKEIELTENTTFVRVYDNMPDGSGMYGSWVMKADDIKGLTPLEIQNKFVLPNTPKYVCDVELEAGTHIRVGEVNPLDGWGNGGGTQYDLIGQRIGDFKKERLLEGD